MAHVIDSIDSTHLNTTATVPVTIVNATLPTVADYRDVPAKPRVVALCGSTCDNDLLKAVALDETLSGYIVLVPFLSNRNNVAEQLRLDVMQMRRIDLADEVLALNVGDVLDEPTAREIRYARYFGKPVRWLEAHECPGDCRCRMHYVSHNPVLGAIPGVLSGNHNPPAEVPTPQPRRQGLPWSEMAEVTLDRLSEGRQWSAADREHVAQTAERLATARGWNSVEPIHVYRAAATLVADLLPVAHAEP